MSEINTIIDQKLAFYKEITTGNKKHIHNMLSQKGISILDGFIKEHKNVKRFYEYFYSKKTQRIVLCGINPGRLGAGKTGVPFLDFKSISNLMPNIQNTDSERSAQFIWSVISQYNSDPKAFFDKVYLTNISWFGFIKDNKNINYYNEALENLKEVFIEGFASEMEKVNPSVIIPLGEEVEKDLKKLKFKNKIICKIEKRLPHPYYCSINNPEKHRQNYISLIRSF